jgi:hypothetical protein
VTRLGLLITGRMGEPAVEGRSGFNFGLTRRSRCARLETWRKGFSPFTSATRKDARQSRGRVFLLSARSRPLG